MKNILIVGAGKMGTLIMRELRRLPGVRIPYVCDICFAEDYMEDGTLYFNDLERAGNLPIDMAFIATTPKSHYGILVRLLDFGIRNIFVEKPAVLSLQEYDRVMSMAHGCRICTGYILRHAESVRNMRNIILGMLADGYRLDSCVVNYEKHHPVTAEPRAMTDLGVFDEMPHLWDLLFNFLDFKRAEEWNEIGRDVTFETAKPDRAVDVTLRYDLSFGGAMARLTIHSSFLSRERYRTFDFVYSKGCKTRVLHLHLDGLDNWDRLSVTDESNRVVMAARYPSLTKLTNEMRSTLNYFATGKTGDVALFKTEDVILRIAALRSL